MIRIFHIVLILWSMFLFVSCASMKVSYEYDEETDFANLNTFNWLEIPQTRQLSEIVVRQVRSSVNSQLEAKGYTKTVSANPDFFIALYPSTRIKEEVSRTRFKQTNFSKAGTFGGNGWGLNESAYVEGTLILDFIDGKDRLIFWSGTATDVIYTSVNPVKIDRAIAEMLKHFPTEQDK